MKTVRYDHIPN